MKTYRTSKGLRIFACAIAIPLILLSIYIIYTILQTDTDQQWANWILASLLMLPIAVLSLGLCDVLTSKVIVGENKLYVKGIVNRELAFDDIKGYRHVQQYIFIEPQSKQHKRIRIQALLEQREEFATWLTTRYPDLDKLAAEEERSEILDTDKFGENIEERIENFQQIKKITRPLNRLAVVIALCTFLWRSPYFYVACMAVFIISVIIYRRHDDVIKFEPKAGSPYPSVSSAMFLSAITLFFFGLFAEGEVLSFRPIWLPLFLSTAIFMGLFLWKNREFTFERKAVDIANTFGVSVIFMMFSFGSLTMISYHLNISKPEIYHAKVLKKNGTCTNWAVVCPIVISAWEKQPDEQEIRIKSEFYHALNENDDVAIHLKTGVAGIRWFQVKPRQ